MEEGALALLSGLVDLFSKDQGLSQPRSQQLVAAIASQRLLKAAAHASSAQGAAALHGSISRLLDVVGTRVAKSTTAPEPEQVAAISLLSTCITNCEVSALLQHMGPWAQTLADTLRRPSSSSAVLAAACDALAALFRRLGELVEVAGVKREASGMASKVVQLLPGLLRHAQKQGQAQQQQLQQQQQDEAGNGALALSALSLTSAVLGGVPAVLRTQAAQLQQALSSLLLRTVNSPASPSTSSNTSGPLTAALLNGAARCLAQLPRCAGDAAAWTAQVLAVLLSAHDVLDYMLMGLEGAQLDPGHRASLVAAGAQQGQAKGQPQPQRQQQQQQGPVGTPGALLQQLPWQQATQQQQQQAQQQQQPSKQMLPAQLLLATLLDTLEQLLCLPFPVPVPVPSYAVAMLAARLLRFDAGAALAAGAVAGSTTMLLDLLALQPSLHAAGYLLLRQLLGAASGQLLPLHGLLARLVGEEMRGVRLGGAGAPAARPAAVRTLMYDTGAALLQAAGFPVLQGITQDLLGSCLVELYGRTAATATAGPTDATAAAVGGKRAAAGAAGSGKAAKRQKTGGADGFDRFDAATATAAAVAASDAAGGDSEELTAQAAAVKLLGQLLAVGGAVLPPEQRAHADAAVAHLAQTTAAAAARLAHGSGPGHAARVQDFRALQLTAYEALLASVLSPLGHRPPFLAQALKLFGDGRSDGSPAIAAFCQGALLQCEALLHPRAVPMAGVRQYAGMEAVSELTRPRMWSALEAQAGVAPAVAAPAVVVASPAVAAASPGGAAAAFGLEGVGPEQEGVQNGRQQANAAVQSQQQQQQQQQEQQQAHEGGASGRSGSETLAVKQGAAATGISTALPGALADAAGAAGQAAAKAANGASRGTKRSRDAETAVATEPAGMQAPQAPTAAATEGAQALHKEPASSVDAVDAAGAGAMASVAAGSAGMQQAIDDTAGVAGTSGQGGTMAAGTAAAGTTKPHVASFLGAPESSDSEGPMPDIDTGSADGDEEDDASD